MAKKSAKNGHVTNKDVDRIWKQLLRAPAICSENDVSLIDRELMGVPHGRNRRAAILLLSRPGKFVIDWANGKREDAVALADGMLAIRDTVKVMRKLADLMETAETRVAVALCNRRDMTEVIAEARGNAGVTTNG